MLDDPVDGRLLGSKRAKIVQRPIGPDDLHAPDFAHLHGQQDRGSTFGWLIFWGHRRNKQIKLVKLGTARLVSCRAVPPPRSVLLPRRSRARRDWLASPIEVILLFGENCCSGRPNRRSPIFMRLLWLGCYHRMPVVTTVVTRRAQAPAQQTRKMPIVGLMGSGTPAAQSEWTSAFLD